MKNISALFSALFSIAVLLLACAGEQRDFESVVSPHGDYTLTVAVTDPLLPHARHVITVFLESSKGDGRQKLIETRLAHDGVPFTAQNIGMRWTGTTSALVCLRPTDRADRGIHISVADAPHAEIRPGC